MENIKSLADQIRRELKDPASKTATTKNSRSAKKKERQADSPFLKTLQDYDTTGFKHMVHVRFDEKTVRLMNQFKMATGVDISKLVAFAVKELVGNTPDIKQIIKHFIENTDL
ncbi:hypothetical protein C8P68_11423 [Mucilaginibacter yixingensis]|uniref:Uncharacterized protein n=1 Tax=Mucilaginibacter yixingensis TaxID=1295612 RepID=A0A2T5J4F0_9SPHI|nr:hypothetical protein [Mucilaginibacter yixingensis]PTQ92148.1 hypothetical protein C8P68_11423 [Mucilaginibacter yixingensis]